MGFVIVLALLLVSGSILFVTFRRLSARRAGIARWLAFCVLVVVGVGIGYRLGFDFEYNVSPNLRVVGFPIPVCAFHFEHGLSITGLVCISRSFHEPRRCNCFRRSATAAGIAVSTSEVKKSARSGRAALRWRQEFP